MAAVNSDDSISPGGPAEVMTPTRRNKRKMTAPKRRSDISIKRLCPDRRLGSLSDGDDGATSNGEPECLTPSTSEPEDQVCPNEPSPSTSSSSPEDLRRTVPEFSAGPSHVLKGIPVIPSGSSLVPGLPVMPGPQDLYHLRLHPGFIMPGLPPPPGMTLPVSLPDERPNRSPSESQDDDGSEDSQFKRPRKNYKNMTRERRVEANARERSRVHTISAAFDSLRRAVPSYSYNQKLSKLAILRIACSYIMALARLADVDYTGSGVEVPSFADCVDMCTSTIQTEGRARRRH